MRFSRTAPSSRPDTWMAGALLAACLACMPAAAVGPEAGAMLRAAADRGPLELARVVDERGDGWVMAGLEPTRSVATRLAAVRAAPWMRAPEQALPALAGLAGGRDVVLAEAAASSLRNIAERLDAITLARREVRPAALAGASKALSAVVEDASARADVRVSAGLVVGVLGQAGVEAP